MSSMNLTREYLCLVGYFLQEAFRLMGFRFKFQGTLGDGDVLPMHFYSAPLFETFPVEFETK